MEDISEFFGDEFRISTCFQMSNSYLLGVRIREIDIMPLLMESVGDFNGFVHIVVISVEIISTELDLHTIRFPWPLEDG